MIDQLGNYTLLIITICVNLILCVDPSYSLKNKQTVQNKDFKGTTMAKESQDVDEFFRKFWHEKNDGLCPFGQVLHRNKAVCCYVTSCEQGYEIKECLKNGTEDECIKCPSGYIQLNKISSLNMSEAKCFEKIASHDNCPIGDMRPSKDKVFKENFEEYCECKHEICYYEHPSGTCYLMMTCGVAEQSNNSGKCERCPWYAYKFEPGCQPCTINVTLIRQGRPQGHYIPPELRTTTQQAESVTNVDVNENQLSETPPGNDDNGSSISNVTILIAVSTVVLLFIAVVVILCIFVKRNRFQGPSFPPSTPTNDSAPLLSGPRTSGTAQVQNGFRNGLYSPTPSPVDGPETRTFPYVPNGAVIPMNGVVDNMRNGFRNDMTGHIGHDPAEYHSTPDNGRESNIESDRTQKNLNLDLNNERARESLEDKRTTNDNFKVKDFKVRKGESERRYDNFELETEGLCGAVGGTNDCNEKVNNLFNCSKDQKEGKVHFCLHNNNIKNFIVNVNGNDKSNGKPESQSNEGVGRSDVQENVSSVLDSSINIGISASPTFAIRGTEQRDIDAIKDANVTGDTDVVEVPAEREVPPCRPELPDVPNTYGQGCDIIVADEKQAENRKEKATTPRATVTPLGGERQVARVVPIRQNSEIRHESGFPSIGMNNGEVNTDYTNVSLSYAILHADYEASYIDQNQDVANLNDVDDTEHSYGPDSMSVSYPDTVSNGQMDNANIYRHSNNAVISRPIANQVGVTSFVQPMGVREVGVTSSCAQQMGEREAPEGMSVIDASENDNIISDDDIEQTDRKVVDDEFDSDITHMKHRMRTDTQTEHLDSDDDLTEYKRRLRQMDEMVDQDADKQREEEDSKADYNVENILYEEETSTLTEEVDKSVSEKTDKSEEKSFELESIDVRNMQTGTDACNKVTDFDDHTEDDEVSKSFEIKSEDIKNLKVENNGVIDKQLNEDGKEDDYSSHGDVKGEGRGCNEETEESFELDSCDIEQIKKDEISKSVSGEASNDHNDDDERTGSSSSSRESSFEIDSADILDFNAPVSRDNAETYDRKPGDGGES